MDRLSDILLILSVRDQTSLLCKELDSRTDFLILHSSTSSRLQNGSMLAADAILEPARVSLGLSWKFTPTSVLLGRGPRGQKGLLEWEEAAVRSLFQGFIPTCLPQASGTHLASHHPSSKFEIW